MMIDFEQARAMAATEARKALLRLAGDRAEYLRSDYVEGHACWIFFRARDIHVPLENSLEGDWAYGISRWGDVRFVYDLSDDPIRMQEYVESLSNFFVRDRAREADRVRRDMTPTTYPVNLAVPLADGGQLVVFISFPSAEVVHHEISGREVVRFDAAGQAMWQIDPEPGTTEGRSHAFDPAIPTAEPFVNVWKASGDHYASRWNGDTFLIALDSGHATFSGWART